MNNKYLLILLFIIVLTPPAFSQTASFNISLRVVVPSCYDGIQNQGETGIDCGGPCSACSTSPGSSGGSRSGGGPSFNRTLENISINESHYLYQKTYFIIRENDSVSDNVNKSELSLNNYKLALTRSVTNATIYIENMNNNPNIPLKNFSRYVYEYFKVSATVLQLSDIGYFQFRFRVPITWVNEQDTTFDAIVVMSYDTKWNELPANFIYNDSEYYYFETATNFLGYYAIVGKEAEALDMDSTAGEDPFTKIVSESSRTFFDLQIIKKIIMGVSIFVIITGVGILGSRTARKLRLKRTYKDKITEAMLFKDKYTKQVSEISKIEKSFDSRISRLKRLLRREK